MPSANNNGAQAARGLKILWVSNAPWTKTGYGVQTAHAVDSLTALGHNVIVFAYYGLDGAITQYNKALVYPGSPVPYGNDMVKSHARATRADVVISLMDVWVQDYWGRKLKDEGVDFCPWLPVDQTPAPERVVERLEGANPAIAMSLFGQRELLRANVFAAYVPHCFDDAIYTPGDQAEARKQMGLPADKFIIGMVAANKGSPSRKCFTEQIVAFARFKQRQPRAWLYLHTNLSRNEQGEDIVALLKALGLEAGVDYGYTSQYDYINGLQPQSMAVLFCSFDVLSNASMGEGFGVPILEAQACGTPVVTSENSAMPELTWAGKCVDKLHPFWTPLNAWAFLPDVDALADAYADLYEQLQDAEWAQAARQRALTNAQRYTIARVREDYWRPLLDGIAKKRRGDGSTSSPTDEAVTV